MVTVESLLPELSNISRGRDVLPTEDAAKALFRSPQTLRKWACYENGPIRPIRIHGRLAWSVADIRRVLTGGAA